MKIAIICISEAWGGLEINVYNLIRWFRERGNEVLLIGNQQSKIAREIQRKGIPVANLTYKGKHLNFKAGKKLKSLLKEHDIENLIIGHYEQFYISVICKLLTKSRIKLIYWQQMQANVKKTDPYHTFFYRQLDAWITPLNYLKEQLIQQTKVKKDIIHTIPLCVEVERFLQKIDKKETRATFDLPHDAFVLGTIGRLDAQKGQEYLIKALALAKKKEQGKEIHVCLIGEETKDKEGYLAYLKDIVKELRLGSFVHFHPFTKNTPMAFAALDVFVMSSLSEPFGMVTIEAMVSGVPVIGTNRGGTKELLEDGHLGLLVDPENEQELAKAISQYYTKPEQFSKKALQTAKQKYAHTTQCELFEQVIEGVSNKFL